MASSEDAAETMDFRTDWTGADARLTHYVNQVLVQVGLPEGGHPDGICLTFGAATPPVLFGEGEIKEEQIRGYAGRLPVQVVSRMIMSKSKVTELIDLLQQSIDQFDRIAEVEKTRAKAKAGKDA